MIPSPLRDRCVLAVEDEYFIAKRLQRDLAAAGAAVLGPVPTVEAALALIAAQPRIDVAMVDVNLRGEMSYAVADALRERGIPFIFVTGYADDDLDARYPGVPRCTKPFAFRDVERMLASALQRREDLSPVR